MAAARNQPTYDFLAGSSTPPKRPANGNVRVSQSIKADEGNEGLRAQIYKLQYEVESLKQERELSDLRRDEQLRSVQIKAEADFRRAQASETSTNITTKKYEALARELQEVQDGFANEKSQLEKRVRIAEDKTRLLQEDADEARAELSSSSRQHQHEVHELEMKLQTVGQTQQNLESEIGARTLQLQAFQQQLSQRETEIGDFESEILRLKAQTGDTDTLAVIKRELNEQVAHIRQLESTNRSQLAELKKFRGQQKAIEVVEEEKRDLQSKLEIMNDLRRQLSEAQLQKQILEDERKQWSAYLEDVAEKDENLNFTTPEELAKAYVTERLERASVMDKLGAIAPELAAKDDIIQSLENEKAGLREEIEKLSSNTNSRDTKANARLERQKNLAIKEVEYLRAQIKTFDAEESEFEPSRYDAQKTARIQELEDTVDQYRKEIQTLHDDLSKSETNTTGAPAANPLKRSLDEADDARLGSLSRKNRKLQEQISQLTTKNNILQKDVDAQKTQVASLKSASRTRILELRSNPTANTAALRQSTLTKLQAENKALLAQLAGDAGVATVPAASLAALRTELEERDRTIADKDKHTMRLKQIFTAKSLEFRDAVASLLGYKLDFMPNGRVRVTSMFHPGITEDEGGEGTGNSIVFDGEQGTMKVSGGEKSEFAGEIRGLIEFWVEGRKEIPCFLAAMTLEFWERSTRATKM